MKSTKEIFSKIAHRYDLLNDILSGGIHRKWRRKALRYADASKYQSAIDLAAGTGDMSIELSRNLSKPYRIMATDITPEMLDIGKEKFKARDLNIEAKIADAQNTGLPDNSYDLATIAFGIRNVPDVSKCLEEMARLVVPGGKVIILEFGQPSGFFGFIFRRYSKIIMPFMGKIIAQNESAYEYLRYSSSVFPCGKNFIELMDKTGKFIDMQYYQLTFGTAFVYIATVK